MAFAHLPCFDIMEQVGKIVVEKRAKAERDFQLGMGARIHFGMKDTDDESSDPKNWHNDYIIHNQYYNKLMVVGEIYQLGSAPRWGQLLPVEWEIPCVGRPTEYKEKYWKTINDEGKDTWEYKDWRKNNPRKRIKSSMPKETRDKIYYKCMGLTNRVGMSCLRPTNLKYIISN